ncbi:hypothetical protein T4B_8354 [Trichinella pseudospiralis]|uniref:Uncharacterized protein n=1 Tax=Trichinella pseudospiralis TaxID=6337 RepID=A0A0V1GV36_TRIPS|nr:hypothetical protein T4B_8354 [Trichinella pseudospiralis]
MKTRTIRSRVENKPHVQFPMGPYSVGLVCGYFKRVKLSHTRDKPAWLRFEIMQYLGFGAAKLLLKSSSV